LISADSNAVAGGVPETTLKFLLGRFSPDALIAAAENRDDTAFAERMAAALYKDVMSAAGPIMWPRIAAVLAGHDIGGISKAEWSAFLEFFRSHQEFGDTSAQQIARVVADAIEKKIEPTSIISFNAEPLLFALIHAEIAKRHEWGPAGTSAPKSSLDRVTRALSSRKQGRIPYVFCHGLLRVPGATSTHVNAESTDKLVFSEDQYLRLGNAIATWQAVTFVETCMTKTIVFIGVSLSDANMRAWLSRAFQNRRAELESIDQQGVYSSQHYWIERRPKTEFEASYIEAAVAHLGVRLVWIEDWSHLGATLDAMLRA
jgi:hypothetical protein